MDDKKKKKKILILGFESLVTCEEGVRHSTTLVVRQSFILINSQVLVIGRSN